MRMPIAAFGLMSLLLIPAAFAQDGPRSTTNPAVPSLIAPGTAPRTATAPSGKVDNRVFPAQSVLPAPTPVEELKPATCPLPTESVEPYLLTRENGPFMVVAKTFRGPDAERLALALVLELRKDYKLPAYILRTKDFPMRSMIRNVPPTSANDLRKPEVAGPEKVRTFDEAAVLVGNEKTLAGSEALWKQVKRIKPKCLNEIPKYYIWREGLSSAIRTTNPYVPTQDIYPGRKKDTLVKQMNDANNPYSVNRCPGRYTLQVAEFAGRTLYNPSERDPRLFDNIWLRKSPLATAADDAERLADRLAKDPEVQRTGYQPYVYHDRTSSRVLVGSFNTPQDPAAEQLRDKLLKMAMDLSYQKDRLGRERAGVMIAPANVLTDLEDPNNPVKQK